MDEKQDGGMDGRREEWRDERKEGWRGSWSDGSGRVEGWMEGRSLSIHLRPLQVPKAILCLLGLL